MAHPPLQPRRRLREADPRGEARDPGGGEVHRLGKRQQVGQIELRLRHLSQLFHSFDPSPFRERELDAQAAEFIEDWASQFPRKLELELLVHLEEPRSESQSELDSIVSEAVASHWAYRAESKRREHRALMARGRTSLVLGLAFFAFCILLGNALEKLHGAPLAEFTRQSFTIGGWVAMWRPLEIFLYDSFEVRRQERVYRRLARMTAHVDCQRS